MSKELLFEVMEYTNDRYVNYNHSLYLFAHEVSNRYKAGKEEAFWYGFEPKNSFSGYKKGMTVTNINVNYGEEKKVINKISEQKQVVYKCFEYHTCFRDFLFTLHKKFSDWTDYDISDWLNELANVTYSTFNERVTTNIAYPLIYFSTLYYNKLSVKYLLIIEQNSDIEFIKKAGTAENSSFIYSVLEVFAKEILHIIMSDDLKFEMRVKILECCKKAGQIINDKIIGNERTTI